MRATLRLVLVVAAALIAASCSSDSSPPKDKPSASAKPGKVEVKDAVFVLNPDKSATLSAKVVNGTDGTYTMPGVPVAVTPDGDYPYVSFYNPAAEFAPGKTTTIGTDEDGLQIRLRPAPDVGTKVSLDLSFWDEGSNINADMTVDAQVVARTSKYDSVALPKLNTKIKVKDGKVVVIPGQAKAYVSGTVVASIEDRSWTLPTAVNAKGEPIKYKHQTVTGGPYGLISLKGREFTFGGPPFTTHEGEEDYFDAKDVNVGEKLTITFPFESGEVVATFTVVAG